MQSYVPSAAVIASLTNGRTTLQNAGFSFQSAVEFTPESDTDTSSGLSTGAIVGIVIAVILAVAIVVVIVVVLIK